MKKDEHFGTAYGLPQVDVTGLESFIPEDEIFRLLGQPCNDKGRIRAIIENRRISAGLRSVCVLSRKKWPRF